VGLRAAPACVTLGFVHMPTPDFADIVALICKEDPRFDRRAYDFVRLGLDATVKEIRRKDAARTEKNRHVSGPELADGLRAYALDQYGPLAKTVLNAWGVKRSRDFGDIVFNLIEHSVFSKTDSDRPEDFADVFDFDTAFVKPFQPARRPRGASATEAFGTA
jgi:uncharacterized repeat protein (TIGR04138 family)